MHPLLCAGAQASSTAGSKSPFQSATKTTQRTKPAGADAGGDQRQRSIALVNEGLEVRELWVGEMVGGMPRSEAEEAGLAVQQSTGDPHDRHAANTQTPAAVVPQQQLASVGFVVCANSRIAWQCARCLPALCWWWCCCRA